jgi:glycerol uptake facilitator-like aquaporin
LNFARSFGPAVFTGDLADINFWIVYFAGPLLGGLVAAWVHQFFASEEAMMPAAPARKSSSRRK